MVDKIFIDESGDPGINKSESSSDFFVIAMIIFNNNNDIAFADKEINNLKLEIKQKTEFKFSRSSNLKRELFFKKIVNINFKVEAIVVDKRKIYSNKFKEDSNNFYNYILRQLITNSKTKLDNPLIIIDGKKDKRYKQSLDVYLRRYINIKDKIKFVDSKGSNLIQLADMVASAINYYEKTNKLFYNTIKNKIHIWYFK